MKLLAALLFVASAALASQAFACPHSAPPQVTQRLEPLLKALEASRKDGRHWDQVYEREFEHLMSATDPISREARIAAMSYYLGESHGVIIACRVAKDGVPMVRVLQLYERCNMMPSTELLPSGHPSHHRAKALRIIRERSWKQNCVFE
jgi:hypothetical protein